MRVFWNSFAEIFGKLSEKRLWGVLFRVAQKKSTAYYRTALQIHSGNAQKGKGILKFQNFKNNFCETVPFFPNATALIHLINKRLLKKYLHTFLNVGKTAAMNVLENYQKNVFSSVPFKKFELSNPATYNYTENWVHHKYFLCLFGEFSNLLGEPLWWNHFLVK